MGTPAITLFCFSKKKTQVRKKHLLQVLFFKLSRGFFTGKEKKLIGAQFPQNLVSPPGGSSAGGRIKQQARLGNTPVHSMLHP